MSHSSCISDSSFYASSRSARARSWGGTLMWAAKPGTRGSSSNPRACSAWTGAGTGSPSETCLHLQGQGTQLPAVAERLSAPCYHDTPARPGCLELQGSAYLRTHGQQRWTLSRSWNPSAWMPGLGQGDPDLRLCPNPPQFPIARPVPRIAAAWSRMSKEGAQYHRLQTRHQAVGS